MALSSVFRVSVKTTYFLRSLRPRGCLVPGSQRTQKICAMAGTRTRVPEVRVGQTNYPGINLLLVTRMLIIECINKNEFQANRVKVQCDWLA